MFQADDSITFPAHNSPTQRSRWIAIFLLVLAPVFPSSLAAADPQLSSPSKDVVEIAGGTGSKAWKIRYGTMASYAKNLAPAGAHRAWLGHGGWLRLMDTEKGVVVGRWHFPGSIVHLNVAGAGVQIQLEEKEADRVFTQLTSFDPASDKAVAYWQSGSLLVNRVPFTEVEMMFGSPSKVGMLSPGWKLTEDQDAKALLATLEEAARRDPMAPLVRVALWRLLREMKDARAAGILEEALAIPSTDFTEQLPIASLLESLNEPDAAKRIFELGYRSLLDRGMDPRLNLGLIGKMILYPSRQSGLVDFTTEHGREIMERHYRLGPYGESADLAWTVYANILERNGRAEDAGKWRVRSEEASHTSLFLVPRRYAFLSDIVLLLVFSSVVSAVLFAVFLNLRYRPQRRADAMANPDRKLLRRLLAAFSFQHWSRGQRVAYLSIAVVAWVGTGFEVGMLRGIGRVAATPLSMAMGSLGGPVSRNYLERSVPASPERDLLLAYSNQQTGRLDEAEKLYRALPQFAESWNNLGVLLRSKGNGAEAKQAFEKALDVDPKPGEAALNLGRPPAEYWAEQYARYFPGRAMLAPPSAQHVSTALFGSTLRQVGLRGLGGPLAGWEALGTVFMISGTGSGDAPADDIYLGLIVGILVLAVVILFVPSAPVTEAPPRLFVIPEVLLPGLAKAWSVLGGWILVAWTYFVFQFLLIYWIGSPFLITAIAQPSLDRSYNVPGDSMGGLMEMFGPGRLWTYYAPIALFVVNLCLVLALRKKSTPEGSQSAR